MMILYVTLLFLLLAVRFVAARRAASLERKYARTAQAARDALERTSLRPGTSNRIDPYRAARDQYVLGQLAQKRDRVEGRYVAWKARSERLGRAVSRLRGWKGRWLPYFVGIIDVVSVLALAGSLADQESLRQVIASVAARFSG